MINFHYLFKFIIVGDTNVGKSCLLLQYTDSKFREHEDITVGVEYGAKEIIHKEKKIKVQIWDTAGQESFRSITRAYYRGSTACLLVFDITNRQTFNSLTNWFEEVMADTSEFINILIVGNKLDKPKRQVTPAEGEELAQKFGCKYIETSAKSGENVYNAFEQLTHSIHNKIINGILDPKDPSTGIKIGSLSDEVKIRKLDFRQAKNCC